MTTIAQQLALDNALVTLENQHGIGKYNMRINPGMKPKEPTYQVVLDALAFTTCYHAFLITANVPGQEFDEPPSEEESLSFIRELGHSREIKYITNVSVDHLHQPWRAFTTIINKCLSRKVSGLNKKKPAKAKKDVPSTKKQATNPKPTKKKTPVKADRGKGLNVLSEVALSEAAQLKESTKQSKKYFHISHASGSGDGTNFESEVLDEQQRKISGTDEGTGTKPRVPDVPKYDSESKKESWGDSREENDDDEDDSKDESDDDKGNDDDGDNDGNDDDSDHERTESDRDENPNLNQSNEEHEKEEEEYVDERVHTPKNYELTDEEDNADIAKEENEEEKDDAEELYRDVNVNLRKEDVEMTYADQGGADQHNVSQVSRFEHVEEDAHVTLTVVHDTHNTEGPMQGSSVSFDFTDKLPNFKNVSSADNEIASLMDTTIRHEEPRNQSSSLLPY
ncbi:hypothetical protein Tco_0894497 [Tanacetum coccineum]|uniref:Uncharacterized protein n=1 Tax=Tanacetum coccineum TaxID=301880 RepID=A0ABQ5CCB5_9ASTR